MDYQNPIIDEFVELIGNVQHPQEKTFIVFSMFMYVKNTSHYIHDSLIHLYGLHQAVDTAKTTSTSPICTTIMDELLTLIESSPEVHIKLYLLGTANMYIRSHIDVIDEKVKFAFITSSFAHQQMSYTAYLDNKINYIDHIVFCNVCNQINIMLTM